MFKQLQAATLEARIRTKDPHIGTRVSNGRIDVVRATPPASGKGAYSVQELKCGLTLAQAIACLQSIK